MVVKVYAYLEGMKELSYSEIFCLLPEDEFDKSLTRDISDRIKKSSQVWSKTLSTIPIGKGLLAHKKDVLIRDDLQDYLKSMDNYSGVLFVDFNKVTDDITKIMDFIKSCDSTSSIGTLIFDDNCGIDQFSINHHRSLSSMANGLLYIPNSRVKEFTRLFVLSLKSSALKVLNDFNDDKNHMTMMNLAYKLKKQDYSSSKEELYNSVAFHEFCKDNGIDYSVLQRINFNKLFNEQKTFKNVKTMTFGSVYVQDGLNVVKIQGNKHIRSFRNGLMLCNPWNYTISDKSSVTKTEFQKNFNRIKNSIEDLEERKEYIGNLFINALESEINEN